MRVVIWAALSALALVAAQAAHAGYKGAEWATTPEQVAAAVPEAKLDGKGVGGKLGKMTVRNAGEIADGARRFRASFYFDERGLAAVELEAPPAECKDVLQNILDVHGKPYRISDQVLFRLFIWHDPSQNNRLRLMVSSAGICTLYYERLDDYKTADDEQAAQGH